MYFNKKASNVKLYNITAQIEGSKKRRNLSITELTNNVKCLIRESFTVVPSSTPGDIVGDNITLIVGQRVRHRFLIDGEHKWYNGSVSS